MLKLEEKSGSRRIAIGISRRRKGRPHSFFFACIFACALHAAAAILFPVRSLIAARTPIILPQVHVNIEKIAEKEGVSSTFAERGQKKRKSLFPPLPPPTFAPLPEMLSAATIAYPHLAQSYQPAPLESSPFLPEEAVQRPLRMKITFIESLW